MQPADIQYCPRDSTDIHSASRPYRVYMLLEIENSLASADATYLSNIPSENLEKRILHGPIGLYGVNM